MQKQGACAGTGRDPRGTARDCLSAAGGQWSGVPGCGHLSLRACHRLESATPMRRRSDPISRTAGLMHSQHRPACARPWYPVVPTRILSMSHGYESPCPSSPRSEREESTTPSTAHDCPRPPPSSWVALAAPRALTTRASPVLLGLEGRGAAGRKPAAWSAKGQHVPAGARSMCLCSAHEINKAARRAGHGGAVSAVSAACALAHK